MTTAPDHALWQAASWAAGTALPAFTDPADLDWAARQVGYRLRPVRLPDDGAAHGAFSGGLIVWTGAKKGAKVGADRRPLALLIDGGPPRLRDPVSGRVTPLTPEAAADLHPDALAVYPTLAGRAMRLRDLIAFGLRIARRDLVRLTGIGLGAGLLSLAIPAASGLLFAQVIPAGDGAALLALTFALLIGAAALTLFDLARGWLTTRLSLRLDHALGAAIWDRVFTLPPTALHAYAIGDLGERALGITRLKPAITAVVVTSLLALTFTLLNTGLLIAYAPALLPTAAALLAIAVLVNLIGGAAVQAAYRPAVAGQGELTAFALQTLTGIAKLQAAGVESAVADQWRDQLTDQRRRIVRAQTRGLLLLTFNGGFPIVAAFALFNAGAARPELEPAAFLGFTVAFNQVLLTLVGWGGTLTGALEVLPYYTRLRPLLIAALDAPGVRPPSLTGQIRLDDVHFHYPAQPAPVLSGLTLETRPGELIGIVGAVGSGKSTLLRLLLGLAEPTSGAIRYDDHALIALDRPALRQQIGVVLQASPVIAGTIRSTIAAGRPLSDAQIDRALTLAGLHDVIRALPMGLATYVSEGGTNFSGGQVQRLLIARALAGCPRVLLLDEATSALDDAAQAHVMRSIRELGITTLVIAHRRETLTHVDRVLELRAGRLHPLA